MTESSKRKTAIGLGVMVVVIIAGVIQLVLLVGGDDSDDGENGSDDAASETTTPAIPTTTSPPIEYQVRPGDTITRIASEHGVPAELIIEMNQLANPDQLTEGQVLLIPVLPPVRVEVAPSRTSPGQTVQLELFGANPGEAITFEIVAPDGPFTGQPHTASPDGTASASYSVGLGDPAGTYRVVARGDQGTIAEATFEVDG